MEKNWEGRNDTNTMNPKKLSTVDVLKSLEARGTLCRSFYFVFLGTLFRDWNYGKLRLGVYVIQKGRTFFAHVVPNRWTGILSHGWTIANFGHHWMENKYISSPISSFIRGLNYSIGPGSLCFTLASLTSVFWNPGCPLSQSLSYV